MDRPTLSLSAEPWPTMESDMLVRRLAELLALELFKQGRATVHECAELEHTARMAADLADTGLVPEAAEAAHRAAQIVARARKRSVCGQMYLSTAERAPMARLIRVHDAQRGMVSLKQYAQAFERVTGKPTARGAPHTRAADAGSIPQMTPSSGARDSSRLSNG